MINKKPIKFVQMDPKPVAQNVDGIKDGVEIQEHQGRYKTSTHEYHCELL